MKSRKCYCFKEAQNLNAKSISLDIKLDLMSKALQQEVASLLYGSRPQNAKDITD
jgi:hypothetical protein